MKLVANYNKEQELYNHEKFIISKNIHIKSLEILLYGFDQETYLVNHFQ